MGRLADRGWGGSQNSALIQKTAKVHLVVDTSNTNNKT